MKQKAIVPILGIVAVLAMAIPASGNTIGASLQGPVTFVVPGVYQWTYNITLSTTATVTPATPSKFTIIDIGGYYVGSAVFAPSANLPGTFLLNDASTTGSVGWTVGPYGITSDNPTIADITGTYSGAAYYSDPMVAGSTFLGVLTLFANTNVPEDTTVYSLDRQGGVDQPSISTTAVPETLAGGPPITPMPIAALGGVGLFGLLAAKRRRSVI